MTDFNTDERRERARVATMFVIEAMGWQHLLGQRHSAARQNRKAAEWRCRLIEILYGPQGPECC